MTTFNYVVARRLNDSGDRDYFAGFTPDLSTLFVGRSNPSICAFDSKSSAGDAARKCARLVPNFMDGRMIVYQVLEVQP